MTDIKLLTLLNDYYTAQLNIATLMIWAIEDYQRGREQHSWNWLFDWCEAKDERSRVWGEFKSEFPRATMLKEGHEV